MGRWTQQEEDKTRLPTGMSRIAYDADTRVYTYRDLDGTLYHGPPGEEYGTLTPVNSGLDVSRVEGSRPGTFDTGLASPTWDPNEPRPPTSFHQFVPANLITSAAATSPTLPSTASSPLRRSATRSQFVEAVRRTALPKMQGVVSGLRRSVTSAKHTRAAAVGSTIRSHF